MTIEPNKIESVAVYKHPLTFHSLAFDRARRRLFAGSADYGIHVFDLEKAERDAVGVWSGHENFVVALTFVDRDARPVVVSGSFDKQLVWWDAQDGAPLRFVAAHDGWIRDLVAFPDGSRLASVGDDMLVKIWDIDSGRLVRSLAGHADRTPQGHVTALYSVAISPDGRYLASGDRHGEVRIWEADSGRLAQRFSVPALYTYDPVQRKRSIGGIRSLAFSPDGRRLAIGGIDQVRNVDGLSAPARMEIWDWEKPEPVAAAGAEEHQAIVNHLVYETSGEWLLGAGGGSDQGMLAVWSLRDEPSSTNTDAAESEKREPTANTKKVEPEDTATTEVEAPALPTLPVHRIKTNGHVHSFCVDEERGELYAAGYQKLEIWALREKT